MEKFSELKEKVRALIFCGGYGTRMWPMSRYEFPKQFQPLLGDESFFEKAVGRVRVGFDPKDIYLSVPQEQVKFVKRQAKGIPEENIIAEPERRDTLGAMGYAAAFLDYHFPGSLAAAVWGADHIVRNEERFVRLLMLGARICQKKDVLVKIDAKPTYPSTANGWVKIGKVIGEIGGYKVYEFIKHIEKPDLERAKRLFTDKRFLINTGYSVWRTSVLLKFYKKYAPECYSHLMKIKQAMGAKDEKKILKKEYHHIEKTSVDYGLFEKLHPGDQLVIPADIGWYDCGTWYLLYEALAIGKRQNITKEDVEYMDSQGNLVYIPKKKIAAIIGVDNLVVVDTKDGLLVCHRSRTEDVKKFYNLLKEKKKIEYL